MDKKIGGGYRQDSTYGGNCTNLIIKGGTIVATAEMYGSAIGKGSGMTCAASNIFVDASLVIKAGDTENPTTEIAKERISTTDIATDFVGKRYATTALSNHS